MLEFGLTGGIGSGKSTVSALLSGRGAVVIDGDAIVRDLQRPGELVFDKMVERWGTEIVNDDGTLNRGAVAGIVFSDDEELSALNAIVHPAVGQETQRRVDEVRGTDTIVVHDIPLLVVPGGELLSSRDVLTWGGIVVVDTPEDLAIQRVMDSREMDRESIVARMSAQATRDERKAVASFLIDNSGDLDALGAQVDECWEWMTGLAGSSDVEDGEAADITATGPSGSSDVEDEDPT
ncbi:MAG: dephospho-CoA kinase [Verrucomicrobiales bacterium]|jgi:dephospho-CoA kinase